MQLQATGLSKWSGRLARQGGIARVTGLVRETVSKYPGAAGTLGLLPNGPPPNEEQVVVGAPRTWAAPGRDAQDPYAERIRGWVQHDEVPSTQKASRGRQSRRRVHSASASTTTRQTGTHASCCRRSSPRSPERSICARPRRPVVLLPVEAYRRTMRKSPTGCNLGVGVLTQ
jgi:hypothetical protein